MKPRLFLAFALTLGCAPSAPPTAADADTAPAGLGPLRVGACRDAPYVLHEAPLGAPLDLVPRPDLSLDATDLDLVLTLADLGALAPTPHDVAVHAFRYTTQDRGDEVEATGLIALPVSDIPDEPWPVVLMLHSFAGLEGPCSPSAGRIEEAIEPVLVASRGFAVVAPDYIGLDGSPAPPAPHAPLVVEQVAIGAWDALRAGRALLGDELASLLPRGVRDDVVVWGYSQGGHAALAVERTGPWLAPDEHVVAVVSGTPPLDQRGAYVDAVQAWTGSTGLAGLILAGMYRWYRPAVPLGDVFVDALAEVVSDALEAPADRCGGGVELSVDDVDELFTPAFRGAVAEGRWDDIEPWSCFLAENSLPTTSIPMMRRTPTLLVFGTADDVVPPEPQAAGVDALCADDARITTLTCDGGDHAFANLWSVPEQEDFVRARLAGDPAPDGCVRPAPVTCSGRAVEE